MRTLETTTRGTFLLLDDDEKFEGVIVYDVFCNRGKTLYVLSKSSELLKLPATQILSDDRDHYHQYVSITNDHDYHLNIRKLTTSCPINESFIYKKRKEVINYIHSCKARKFKR